MSTSFYTEQFASTVFFYTAITFINEFIFFQLRFYPSFHLWSVVFIIHALGGGVSVGHGWFRNQFHLHLKQAFQVPLFFLTSTYSCTCKIGNSPRLFIYIPPPHTHSLVFCLLLKERALPLFLVFFSSSGLLCPFLAKLAICLFLLSTLKVASQLAWSFSKKASLAASNFQPLPPPHFLPSPPVFFSPYFTPLTHGFILLFSIYLSLFHFPLFHL